MGIELIVSDLDGTLLSSDHTVSEANCEAVRKAVEAGVTFTIATGRMYSSALPYAKQLAVDVPIITYNGAVIKTVSGKDIFTQYIEADLVQAVTKFCQANDWYVQIYSDETLYFAVHDETAKAYEFAAGIMGVAVGAEKLATICSNVPKILVIVDDITKTDGYTKALQKAFGDKLFVTKSNVNYIEMVDLAVSKATALEALIKNMQLTKEQVMAIGDSNNDVPMLRYAGVSVAMGNATKEIQSICTHVTGGCDEDGVAMAIEKYVLETKEKK